MRMRARRAWPLCTQPSLKTLSTIGPETPAPAPPAFLLFEPQDARIESVAHAAKRSPAVQGRVCSSFPGLKRTALPGIMLTSAPVRGFLPIPVLRGLTLKTPNPRNSIRSPLDKAFFIEPKTVSTAISALVLVIPVRLTTSLTRSSFIKRNLLKTQDFIVKSRFAIVKLFSPVL